MLRKEEHRKRFAYEAYTAYDRRGYVLEKEVTPGNVHDSVAFDTVFKRLIERYPEVQVITIDVGCKTSWSCKRVSTAGEARRCSKRPVVKKDGLPMNSLR